MYGYKLNSKRDSVHNISLISTNEYYSFVSRRKNLPVACFFNNKQILRCEECYAMNCN